MGHGVNRADIKVFCDGSYQEASLEACDKDVARFLYENMVVSIC
jgi:hypothetical protein